MIEICPLLVVFIARERGLKPNDNQLILVTVFCVKGYSNSVDWCN